MADTTDLDTIRRILLEAAQSVHGAFDDPQPVAYLVELGDWSVNWAVGVWTATVDSGPCANG